MGNVLIVYTAQIPTVDLICGLMKNYSLRSGRNIISKPVFEVKTEDIRNADSVLAIRPFEVGIYRVICAAKDAGKKVIVYLDDDLLNVPNEYASRLRQVLANTTYSRNSEYLKKSLALCDVLWGSNTILLNKYEKYIINGRTALTDVTVNATQFKPIADNDGRIVILFAGSGDHAQYLNDRVIPAINNVQKKSGNIRFVCVGVDPSLLKDCLAETQYYPWLSNYEAYNNLMQSMHYDIAVAPLKDGDFYRCKYFNKFIEYTKLGVVGIYHNDYPYKLIIEDGINGVLADDSVESWTSKIEYLIDNAEARKHMVKNAQKLCVDRFSDENLAKEISKNIPEFLYDNDNNGKVKYKPTIFMNCLRKNVTEFVEQYEYRRTKKKMEDKKVRILLVTAGYTTTNVLLENMLQLVAQKTEAILKSKDSSIVTAGDIRDSDIIFFTRGAEYFMSKIAESANLAGRRTVLYLDDDLYGIYQGTVEGDALLKCLNNCDILWSSNDYICKKYLQYNKDIKVVTEKVFEPIVKLDDVVKVDRGYKILFAGSPSHKDNLQKIIIPALNKLHRMNIDFTAVFAGFRDGQLESCEFNTEYIPWTTDADEYRRFVKKKGCHIGIAIITDNEFGNCKYYNKYLEYSRMGIAGIYSDVYPYRMVVKNDVNGILVKNDVDSWAEAIEKLMTNEALRLSMVENSQKNLREDFKIEDAVDRLCDKIPEIRYYKSVDHKVNYHSFRVMNYIRFVWRKLLY
ncbi:glycosyltransferase [Butyrivibrio sp. AE3006]|uniref:glycosyltransferase n=1 Tax=Butyrivibrio sp. AE3006 TaxID=1280673 RepID=UPI0004108632|nr:glycosyltransferase [Butyrivibrio sp. AE3006]